MSKLHREITITPIGVYVEQAIRVHNNNARGIGKDAIAILNYLTAFSTSTVLSRSR